MKYLFYVQTMQATWKMCRYQDEAELRVQLLLARVGVYLTLSQIIICAMLKKPHVLSK